jgi:hypothetical protein
MLQKIKSLVREIGVLSLGLTIAFVIFMGLSIAKGAWIEPGSSAPDGNVSAPINISTILQDKAGSLGIDGAFLDVLNNLYVHGKVGIGTVTPATKLDVAGTVKGTGIETGTLRVTTGAGTAGKVLTSDINGSATWQAGGGIGVPVVVQGPTVVGGGTSIATCPAGYGVTGGGAGLTTDAGCSAATKIVLANSYPNGNTGWGAQLTCGNGFAWAVCLKM